MESIAVSTSNVFTRLIKDAEKRQKQERPVQSSMTERTGPRHKIEEDLLERWKLSKARLNTRRAKQQAEARQEETGIPSINPESKRIMNARVIAETDEQKAKHKSVHSVAYILRNRENSSLSQPFESFTVRVNLMTSADLPHSQIFSQTSDPFDSSCNANTEQSFAKRSSLWRRRKNTKIQKMIDEKHSRELDGCTFKPQTQHVKTEKKATNSQHIFGKMNLLSLSPSNARISYANGFALDSLLTRAQPMLEYIGKED